MLMLLNMYLQVGVDVIKYVLVVDVDVIKDLRVG